MQIGRCRVEALQSEGAALIFLRLLEPADTDCMSRNMSLSQEMWKALALACSAYCSSYVLTNVKHKEGVLSSKAQNTTALLGRCLQCQNRQGSVRFRWSGMYCMGLRQVPPAAWCGGSCSSPVCTAADVLRHVSACCHCMQTSQRRRRMPRQ